MLSLVQNTSLNCGQYTQAQATQKQKTVRDCLSCASTIVLLTQNNAMEIRDWLEADTIVEAKATSTSVRTTENHATADRTAHAQHSFAIIFLNAKATETIIEGPSRTERVFYCSLGNRLDACQRAGQGVKRHHLSNPCINSTVSCSLCRVSLPDRLVGLVVKASASRAEGPGFQSRLRRDFFGVESYQ